MYKAIGMLIADMSAARTDENHFVMKMDSVEQLYGKQPLKLQEIGQVLYSSRFTVGKGSQHPIYTFRLIDKTPKCNTSTGLDYQL